MKNTKKIVALALAMSIGSQAITSSAVESNTGILDTSAPSTKGSLDNSINEKTNELTITQKGIYDLESGLDVNSVKAYIYETGSKDKGKALSMSGNDFSDFTVTTSIPSNAKQVNVEIEASDLAGNTSIISKEVINVSSKSAGYEYVGYNTYYQDNGVENGGDLKVSTSKPFRTTAAFADSKAELKETSFIINTDKNNSSNGMLYSGKIVKDGKLETSFNNGTLDVVDSSIEHDGFMYSRAELSIDTSKLNYGYRFYIWIKNEDGVYVNSGLNCYIDNKSPEAKSEVELKISSDNVLFVTQADLSDEALIHDVYALVKHEKFKEPKKIGLFPSEGEDFVNPSKFDGSLNLAELGVTDGEFTVEVYAVDVLGNEGLVSKKVIGKDVEIESTERLSISGEVVQSDNKHWFGYKSEMKISAVSESKDKVYNGAQIIINEDPNDCNSKVLANFKLGSKEDLTGINNKYFELKSSSYNSTISSNDSSTYNNNLNASVVFKEGTYNKNLNVWVVYYTDKGITTKPLKLDSVVATDYDAPTAKITKESNKYVISYSDAGSKVVSVNVYSDNGLLLNSEEAGDGKITVSADLNPSTVTLTDLVNNKTTYNIKTGEIIEAGSTSGLPNKPSDKDDTSKDDEVNKPTNKPTDKPADKPTDKPTDKPEVKPEDKPVDKPTNKPTDKPVDKPTDKPVDKPTDKPEDKPTDKPVDRPEDKPNTPSDKDEDNKPSDKDETNKDESNGSTTTPGGSVTVNPSEDETNGDTNTVNTTTSNSVSKLPQTGNEVSLFAGLIGTVTSTLGFMLTRKKK